MAEVVGESQRLPSHAARTTLFLAAMRHFAIEREAEGWKVHYRRLGRHDEADLSAALRHDLATLQPAGVTWLRPGEHGVREGLWAASHEAGLEPEEAEPARFFDTPAGFAAFAGDRAIRQEGYYRHLRRRTGILMEGNSTGR